MELSILRVFLAISCAILSIAKASNLSVELLVYKERIKVLSGELAVKCPSAPLPDLHTNSDNFLEVKSAYDKLARTLVECQRPKVEQTTPKVAEKTTTGFLSTKSSIAITSAPLSHSAKVTTTNSLPWINNISCDFDTNLCGFTQSTSDQFDWTRRAGYTPSGKTGPSKDHTTGNGNYVYIETSNPQQLHNKANLVSEIVQADEGFCLSFWYHMWGRDIGSLRVVTQVPGELACSSLLFHRAKQLDSKWHQARVTVKEKQPYRLVFSGTAGYSYTGDIALDDISFTKGACTAPVTTFSKPCLSSSSLPIECNFDNGICGFAPSLNDASDWILNSGETPSRNAGPSFDHTSGKGQYIYTTTPMKDDAAVLISPFINVNTSVCLRFWYHMYETTNKGLSVSTIGEDGRSVVFQKLGSLDKGWHESIVSIPKRRQYQLTFSAIAISRAKGYIALDDISIRQEACPSTAVVSKSPCLAATNATVLLCCDFDLSMCGLTQFRGDDFDWSISSNTASVSTGPTADHTTGHGRYAYIEASAPRRLNDTASLLSPVFQTDNSPSCLKFWYNMYGKDVNTLRVSMRATDGGSNPTLFQRIGEQDRFWHEASVDVVPTSEYQLEFWASRGNAYRGDIAIDDIMLTEGLCSAN